MVKKHVGMGESRPTEQRTPSRPRWARRPVLTTQPRFRATAFVILVGASGLLGCWAATPFGSGREWPATARIGSPAISESSGIIKSRSHDDVYWTHNDSGHAPVLFAINLDGKVNAEALAHIERDDLASYLDQEGINVIVDWPSYLMGHLPMDYAVAHWQPAPLEIPNGMTACFVRKGSPEARQLALADGQ